LLAYRTVFTTGIRVKGIEIGDIKHRAGEGGVVAAAAWRETGAAAIYQPGRQLAPCDAASICLPSLPLSIIACQ